MAIVNNTDESTETSLASSAAQVSSWTVDDIKKSDILVFRENGTEYVDTVVAPNGFQVGLLDEAFLTDLLVTGHITGSGVIYAELGFSGSLTKLVDGDDYLVAGTGVTLTTQSNGSILIESTGGGGTGLRIKEIYNENVPAGTPLATIPLAEYNYSFDTIDVHYNGELMKSGSSGEVQSGDADYYLLPDANGAGQIVFNTNLTISDDITLTINGGGGSGGGGSTVVAGDAISYSADVLDVLVDDFTVSINASNELEVNRTKGTITANNGLNPVQFDGSSSVSFSVKPVANTPITVSTAGVGFDLPGQMSAVQLDPTDEILIHDGAGYKKTTVQDILDLTSGGGGGTSSVDAPYLTISNSVDLNSERAIVMGDGLDSIDQGPNNSYIVSIALDTNSGLKFVSGKLAVDIGSFAGLGLIENQTTGELEIDYSTVVGEGLTHQAGVISIDFGRNSDQVAKGSNTVSINSGDGLAGGSTVTIGNTNSSVNLRVDSADLAGIGLHAQDNDLYLNLATTGGITHSTGSNGEIILDGQGILDAVENYDWGLGLTGTQIADGETRVDVDAVGEGGITIGTNVDGQLVISGQDIIDSQLEYHFGDGFDVNELVAPEDVQLDWGSGNAQVPRGDTSHRVVAGTGLEGGGTFIAGQESELELRLDVEGTGGIQVYSDLDGKVIIDGSSISGGGTNGNTFDFDQIEVLNEDGTLVGEINAGSVGDQFGIKAGTGVTLDLDGSNIVISTDTSTSSQSNGGTATVVYGAGPGIEIQDTFLVNQKMLAVDYETTNNLVAEAPDGFDITVSNTDTILLRDASDDIVKEVSISQIADIMPAGGGTGTVAATGVEQHVVRVSETIQPLSDVTFVDLDASDVPDGASLSVYLNGDLLLSGSIEDTTAMSTSSPRIPTTTNTHYYLSGTSTLAFGVGLVEGDYLIVEKTSLANATNTVLSVLADSGLKQNDTVGDIHIQVEYDGVDTSLIKSAYDGTLDTIDPAEDYMLIHDATTNQDKYVLINQLPLGSGGTGGSGTIGSAEDGTYTDGLFTDFVSTTPVGTAVDRFNEVLKILAPPPAPNLKTMDYSITGSVYNGLLSFDDTHPDPAGLFTNIQTYTQSGENGFTVPIVNEAYSADSIEYPTSNYDGTELYFFRAGVISGNETITGECNFNVGAQVAATGIVQLAADSYGNGDIGTLNLEVNGNIVHTIDLSTFVGSGEAPNGSASDLNANGSGFTRISEARTSFTEGGTAFPSFMHRSTNYLVDQGDMQPGFNIARVIHLQGTATYVTNYVEWVLDNTTDPITFSNDSVGVTNSTGSLWISGVQYHSSMELGYNVDIDNAYKAIYSTNPIVTTSTEGVSSNVNIPPLGVGDDMTKQINFSNSITVNASSSTLLNETVGVNITVPHPIKGSTSSSVLNTNPLLLYTVASNATDTSEDFALEEYRLQEGDYLTQTAGQAVGFYDSVSVWDPTISLTSADLGHNTGLQIYNGRLLSPSNTIDVARVGDFRNLDDGGVLETHSGNPDYSIAGGSISGVRTYYRYIKNTTSNAQRDLRIIYNGQSSLVNSGATLDTDKIKVSIKMPTNPNLDGTGWMDANAPFSMFDYSDGAGGYVLPTAGSFDSSINGNTTNYFTFGKNEVLPDEVVIVKIEADTSWTGFLDDLSVEWGASASGQTAPGTLSYTSVPLQQVSISQTGVEAKLSFGPTNPLAGYTDVYDPDTNAVTDYNEIYGIAGYQRGVFDNTLMTGVLNDTFNDRFERGDLGELKLEVNGNVIVTVDLTNLNFSGNFVDNFNSGFYNLSVATPSEYASNGIPSFNNIYRSGQVRIQTASQDNGHNYYRVIHTVGGVDSVTNYCEWVNDTDATPLLITNESMSDWTDTQVNYQSGVGYFEDPDASAFCLVSGLYTKVYSTDGQAIGWTSLSNVDITNNLIEGNGIVTKNTSSDATTLPNLIIGGEAEDVELTASLNWNGPTRVLPGTHGTNGSTSVSLRPRVHHPIKNSGNYLLGTTVSKNNFLIASFNNTSTDDDLETFDTEDYRMPDATYTTDTDVTSATWDSTISLVSNTVGYSNALMQYNGKLIAPSKGGVNGDFTTYPDGGIYQGPAGNPDYSGVATQEDERIYIRAFYNTTTGDYANLDVDITGVGTLTSEQQISNSAGAIGANNRFKMFVKLVEPTANNKATTGWLDCGEQATGSLADFAGCSTLPLNQLAVNLGSNTSVPIQLPTGRYLYGTTSPLNTNYLLIKIVAHKEWTGNLTKLGVSF